MSHEITIRADGMAEMAYAGEPAWHRLGNQLPPGASLEKWLKASGMDFTIRRAKATFFADRAQTELIQIPNQVVLYRSDNQLPLGIVSDDYQIVQPYELLEFFRDLVEGAGFQIETAGTLYGGKKFWVLAKVTEAVVAGWDRIGSYLLLSTSADGSSASDGRHTSVRVVCRNTLEQSLGAHSLKGHRVSVSHRQVFDEEKVKRALGLNQEHFKGWMEAVELLAKTKVGAIDAEDFLTKLLRSKGKRTVAEVEAEGDIEGEEDLRKPRGFDTIMALFEGQGMGATEPGSKGTLWGLVNAVTEYVDHRATAKTADHRINRAWFGSGNDMKESAFVSAYVMAQS